MAGDMTDSDFAAKVHAEGGLLPAIFDYGLTSDDLANTDGDLYRVFQEFEAWARGGEFLIASLERVLARYDIDDAPVDSPTPAPASQAPAEKAMADPKSK